MFSNIFYFLQRCAVYSGGAGGGCEGRSLSVPFSLNSSDRIRAVRTEMGNNRRPIRMSRGRCAAVRKRQAALAGHLNRGQYPLIRGGGVTGTPHRRPLNVKYAECFAGRPSGSQTDWGDLSWWPKDAILAGEQPVRCHCEEALQWYGKPRCAATPAFRIAPGLQNITFKINLDTNSQCRSLPTGRPRRASPPAPAVRDKVKFSGKSAPLRSLRPRRRLCRL